MPKQNGKQSRKPEPTIGTGMSDMSGELTDGMPEPASVSDGRAASKEDIAVVAYERWLSRGQPQGSDQDDWFEAERRLQEQAGGQA